MRAPSSTVTRTLDGLAIFCEIAGAPTVAEGTAANHVFRLMSRFGFHSRAQIAAWAVEQRLHE